MVYNRAQTSSDHLPSYPSDSHHCLDNCLLAGKRLHGRIQIINKTVKSKIKKTLRSDGTGVGAFVSAGARNVVEQVSRSRCSQFGPILVKSCLLQRKKKQFI